MSLFQVRQHLTILSKVEIKGNKTNSTTPSCFPAPGLPNPRNDHAQIMASFAASCLDQVKKVTRDLEVHLGPETGDLAMRLGLHSGPVTAGVLRGEKSRFQLFGDTMNMSKFCFRTACCEIVSDAI